MKGTIEYSQRGLQHHHHHRTSINNQPSEISEEPSEINKAIKRMLGSRYRTYPQSSEVIKSTRQAKIPFGVAAFISERGL